MSDEIKQIERNIETKYGLTDYDDICLLFYRGNDKITETTLPSYKDFIDRARYIHKVNPFVKFIVQSDETEFLELCKRELKDVIIFYDEIRHINKTNSTVDVVFKDQNFIFSKYYLAIKHIMSKCKFIIFGSGNCSIWILFYRGHARNVMQYLRNQWVGRWSRESAFGRAPDGRELASPDGLRPRELCSHMMV